MRHVDRVVRRLEDSMDTPITIGRARPEGAEAEPIRHLKPPIEPAALEHKHLQGGPFWQRIPTYRGIDEGTFLDHARKAKTPTTHPQKHLSALKGWCPTSMYVIGLKASQ